MGIMKTKSHLEEEGDSTPQPWKKVQQRNWKKKIQSVNKTTENKGGGVASPQASWINASAVFDNLQPTIEFVDGPERPIEYNCAEICSRAGTPWPRKG